MKSFSLTLFSIIQLPCFQSFLEVSIGDILGSIRVALPKKPQQLNRKLGNLFVLEAITQNLTYVKRARLKLGQSHLALFSDRWPERQHFTSQCLAQGLVNSLSINVFSLNADMNNRQFSAASQAFNKSLHFFFETDIIELDIDLGSDTFNIDVSHLHFFIVDVHNVETFT